MGDLPCQTGRRASALTVNVKQRVKLHQIHRLQLTAAAQRLNDAQQRGQRHAQRRRGRHRRHFSRRQHVEIDSQIQTVELRDIALKLRQHASFEGCQHLQIFNDSHLAARRFIP